jgi:hypothetical protein
MILYQLNCTAGHRFEAWFLDAATFDSQLASGDVSCPVCGDIHVAKTLTAPSLNTGAAKSGSAEVRAKEVAQQILKAVNDLRQNVEENCEYVGAGFTEEARSIHSGEAEERGIYGEATEEEACELDEDGIPFFRIPSAPRRSH